MAPLTCTAQFGTCGRKLQFVLAMAGIAGLLCGCETVRFYGQAIRGQYQIMARRQPFEKVMLAANTPAALKAQLELVRKLREFAEKELQLPVNGQYERYVDVGRRYVVWNVHATPEFSLEPKTWCYPIVGRLKYRG
jgi:predicted aminopeptidase